MATPLVLGVSIALSYVAALGLSWVIVGSSPPITHALFALALVAALFHPSARDLVTAITLCTARALAVVGVVGAGNVTSPTRSHQQGDDQSMIKAPITPSSTKPSAIRPKTTVIANLSHHPEAQSLVTEFLSMTADLSTSSINNTTPSQSQWQIVLTQSRDHPPFHIQVHKRTGSDFCFRVVASLNGTPEETFDLLSDIRRRPEYDPVCEESGHVAKVDNMCSVNYFRTRGFWPTASRDALVKSYIHLLPDGRYLNVTSSIPSHPSYTSRPGDVRMLARIAGQLVEPDPAGRPGMCRVIQVMDGDLCGWIPQAIVSMITTQAFPVAMRKVDKVLRGISVHQTSSRFILEAEGKLVEVVEGEEDVQGERHQGDEQKHPSTATPPPPTPSSTLAKKQTSSSLRAWFVVATKYLGLAQPWMVAATLVWLVVVSTRRRLIGP